MATYTPNRRRFSIGLITSTAALLLGCTSQLAVLSVYDVLRLPTASGSQAVAAIVVWESDTQVRLYNTILLTADAPPLYSQQSLPLDASSLALTDYPWRDTGTTQYLPAIISIDTNPTLPIQRLTAIRTEISEYRIGYHPNNQLIRLTGMLLQRDGQILLVDQHDARRKLALQPTPELRQFSTQLPVFVEGVAVDTTFLALVVAPITD